MCGQRSWGRDKTPPIKGLRECDKLDIERKQEMMNPIMYPTDQATGGIENPRATLVSSVSSAIMLLTEPMCPFNTPCKHRLRSSGQSVYIVPEGVDIKAP